jgi:hypothetical protein
VVEMRFIVGSLSLIIYLITVEVLSIGHMFTVLEFILFPLIFNPPCFQYDLHYGTPAIISSNHPES